MEFVRSDPDVDTRLNPIISGFFIVAVAFMRMFPNPHIQNQLNPQATPSLVERLAAKLISAFFCSELSPKAQLRVCTVSSQLSPDCLASH